MESSTTLRPARSVGPLTSILLWLLQLVLALAFLAAGSAKVLGARKMVETFAKLGFGQWFRYLTGGLEVAAAVMLLVPSLCGLGGLILVCVMIGAVATHLFLIGGNPTPAAVLLVLAALIAWFRRDRTLRLIGRA